MRKFLVLCKKQKYFNKAPPLSLVYWIYPAYEATYTRFSNHKQLKITRLEEFFGSVMFHAQFLDGPKM